MKQIFTYCLIVPSLLISCISETECQQPIDQKSKVFVENDQLKNESEEIKFRTPNLLTDGKKYFEAKNYSKVGDRFKVLLEKNPDLPISIEAHKYLTWHDE